MEDILRQPEKLEELNLDAFAEELERQGFGNKQVILMLLFISKGIYIWWIITGSRPYWKIMYSIEL